MVEIDWKDHVRPPLIVRFGKKLKEGTEETLHEPLPEGWKEIIKRLNDEEQTERKTLK